MKNESLPTILPARAIAIFVVAGCLSRSIAPTHGAATDRNVFWFDAGATSALSNRFTQLPAAMPYSPESGYGWKQAPQRDFARPELARSRPPELRDGVEGENIEFRVDAAPGVWRCVAYIDVDSLEAPPPLMLVQGNRISGEWHRFSKFAEPRDSAEKIFRVCVGTATAEENGITVKFRGRTRLLGLSMLRVGNEATNSDSDWQARLRAAGRWRSTDSLASVRDELQRLREQRPDDPLLALASDQAAWLAQAEEYISLGGWEHASLTSGLGMQDRFNQAVLLLDAGVADGSSVPAPLAERARWRRGRLLFWQALEHGGSEEQAAAQRDLAALAEAHPDDDLLAMYLGKHISAADECDCLEPHDAPRWSVLQREALCRLRLICHWWVNERQTADGQFGCKYGDDVELTRWWSPLILVGDETALLGLRRIADGVWNSDHVAQGYASRVRDVEHAAEFIADTAPLMAVISDDDEYLKRLSPSVSHFEHLWTAKSPQGRRYFRSAWFSATEVDLSEPRNRDVEYNTRAVRAIRYWAWKTRDPQATRLLHEWSAAWAHAAMREDKGKPRGIFPPSIRGSDEAINGDESSWKAANMQWEYFDWQFSAGSGLYDQLLFTSQLIGDAQLLEPLTASLNLIEQHAEGVQGIATDHEADSPEWAAKVLRDNRDFWAVVEQRRFLTGEKRWDNLIERFGTPYGRYRVTSDPAHLEQGLSSLLANVRFNLPMVTTEALYSDRVYAHGWETLKAMLTGDGMPENSSPYFAATWERTNADFTALVRDSSSEYLTIEIFSHSPENGVATLRPWRLCPGAYQMTWRVPGRSPRVEELHVSKPGGRISVELPSRTLVELCIEPR